MILELLTISIPCLFMAYVLFFPVFIFCIYISNLRFMHEKFSDT